jgi:hypothetical protein
MKSCLPLFPHVTAVHMIISVAAALDLELHSGSCDMAQAFIQADKLEKGVNGQIFITLPKGFPEEA